MWGGGRRSHLGRTSRRHPPHPRPTLATLAYRGLTLVLAALALLGQAVYLDALHWNALGLGRLTQGTLAPALLSAAVTGAVVTFVTAGAGVTMAFRRGGERGAHPLGLALVSWGYLLAYSGLTILLAPDPSSPWRLPFEAHFLLVEAVASAALVRFTAVFPSPLRIAALTAPEQLPVGLRTAQRGRILLLTPWGPWAAAVLGAGAVLGANAAGGGAAQDAGLNVVADAMRLGALAVVTLNLRSAFRDADLEGRRALFWFVVGFTLLLGAVGLLLGGNVLTAVTGWEIQGFNWRPVVLDLGVVGLVWGAAMGVYYAGPLRPGLVARRAGVLAGAATVALFLAAGLESLVAGVVATRITLPEGIGTVVAAVAVGLLYMNVRRPVESALYHAWSESAAKHGAEPAS